MSTVYTVAPTPWGTGTRAPPHFYKWPGTGGTVSRRTANKKLTKLYWQSRKRSTKRLIAFLEKKGEGHDRKNFFRRFALDRCPHFQICSSATVYRVVQKRIPRLISGITSVIQHRF